MEFPSVQKAQENYVSWATKQHWMRKQLMANRAGQWRQGGATLTRLQEEEPMLMWLMSESEHWMIYWRNVLEAHGIRPGGINH